MVQLPWEWQYLGGLAAQASSLLSLCQHRQHTSELSPPAKQGGTITFRTTSKVLARRILNYCRIVIVKGSHPEPHAGGPEALGRSK